MLQRHEFPHCCGIDVLYDFPFQEMEVEMVLAVWSRSEIKDRKDVVDREINECLNKLKGETGAILISLNEVQKKFLGSVLTKNKFRLIDKSKNPNTFNTVYLYSYNYDKNKQPSNTNNRVF